jgi:hypothetical protein
MKKKRINPDVTREKAAIATFPLTEGVDPNVVVPVDVQASIARAEAVAAPLVERSPAGASKGPFSDFRTAVTDQEVQDARDRYFDSLEAGERGKRQQPRMVNRLRAIDLFVQREIANGTVLGVGPNSVMNRKVREWLNARAARTTDERKSRRKQITGGAVRALLKKIKAMRGVTGD